MVRLAYAALVTAALLMPASAQTPPTVTLASGSLSGTAGPDGVASFLGVPFAAPPTGSRRWRAPGPVEPWAGVRDATAFAPSCIQATPSARGPWSLEFFAPPPYSEDCLYLNVWTPSARPAGGVPVAVYLPGGGLTQGGANEVIYHGDKIARDGVMFVSINYRLGALGFLAHPELAAEAGGVTGNYGLMDVVAALAWVKQNARAFGGDPDKVTVIGQSAGAWAISALLSSPAAKGLFRGAIAQSGLRVGEPAIVPLADAMAAGRAWAESRNARSLADLRALPSDRFVPTPDAPFRTAITVDGQVVAQPLSVALLQAPVNDVPIMVGFNADEGMVRRPLTEDVTSGAFEQSVRATYGRRAEALLALPRPEGEGPTRAAQALEHGWTMQGARAWNVAHARHATANLYAYEFERVMPGYTAADWGSFHTAEVPYAFRTLDSLAGRPWTELDRRISEIVSGYWLNFIKTGDPNGPDLPRWAPFDGHGNVVMGLGAEPKPKLLGPDAQATLLQAHFSDLLEAGAHPPKP